MISFLKMVALSRVGTSIEVFSGIPALKRLLVDLSFDKQTLLCVSICFQEIY